MLEIKVQRIVYAAFSLLVPKMLLTLETTKLMKYFVAIKI